MAVYQTNTFICEKCGKIVSITEKQSIYYDPVISPPVGWEDEVCGGCVEDVESEKE